MKVSVFNEEVKGGNDLNLVLEKALLDRGYSVLMKELGADGAMKFLKASEAVLQEHNRPHDFKPLLMQVVADKDERKIRFEFSREVSWVSFDKSEVRNIINLILEALKSI